MTVRGVAKSPLPHPNPCPSSGFTLLEVLAAMVLLALLMLGVYAGIRIATHTVHAGTAAVQGLDEMRAAQQFIRRELGQARTLPWARNAQGQAVFFVGDARAVRFVAPLPGYLGKLGPQVQTLQLVRDGDGLRLEVSFSQLPADGSAPRSFGTPQVLLRGIRAGHFSYRGFSVDAIPGGAQDDTWQTEWPNANMLPAIVRLDLQREHGAWPQLLVAPRVDPSAAKVPTTNLPLQQATQP